MTTTTKGERLNTAVSRATRSRTAWVVIIVASLCVIGIGVRSQQAVTSAQDAARDAQLAADRQAHTLKCVQAWAHEFTATTRTRVDATGKLERAKNARDDGVDKVIDIVILARRHPPQAGPKDFDRALAEWDQAKQRLVRVEAEVSHTRHRNPYPVLRC